MLETKVSKIKALITELKAGEKSGMISNFDRNKNLQKLHAILLKK